MLRQVFICCGKYECFILSAGITRSKRSLSDTPPSLFSLTVSNFCFGCCVHLLLCFLFFPEQQTKYKNSKNQSISLYLKQLNIVRYIFPVVSLVSMAQEQLSSASFRLPVLLCLGWVCCIVLPFLAPACADSSLSQLCHPGHAAEFWESTLQQST